MIYRYLSASLCVIALAVLPACNDESEPETNLEPNVTREVEDQARDAAGAARDRAEELAGEGREAAEQMEDDLEQTAGELREQGEQLEQDAREMVDRLRNADQQ